MSMLSRKLLTTDESGAANASPRPVDPLGIIAERLNQIAQHASGMAELDSGFVEAIRHVSRLANGLAPYMADCTTPESAALSALVARTQSTDWAAHFSQGETTVALEQEMLSGHVEGQFLKFLVGAMRAKRILEIGLFTGYSALAMAEALPGEGRLVACEIDPFAAELAQKAFDASPHGQKIEVHVGDAARTLQRLNEEGASFDLIFIDADKAAYGAYFDIVLGGSLLSAHGAICVDNTLMQGSPWMPEPMTPNGSAIAEFNRMVRDDERVEQVLIPLRDGLTLIRRRESGAL